MLGSRRCCLSDLRLRELERRVATGDEEARVEHLREWVRGGTCFKLCQESPGLGCPECHGTGNRRMWQAELAAFLGYKPAIKVVEDSALFRWCDSCGARQFDAYCVATGPEVEPEEEGRPYCGVCHHGISRWDGDQLWEGDPRVSGWIADFSRWHDNLVSWSAAARALAEELKADSFKAFESHWVFKSFRTCQSFICACAQVHGEDVVRAILRRVWIPIVLNGYTLSS